MRGDSGRLYALTGAVIAVQLLGAVALKFAVDAVGASFWAVCTLLAVHLLLQCGRFALTWQIQRAYPVARSYPLTALFLPAVVLLAAAMGEPLDFRRACAVAIVISGVVLAVAPEARPVDQASIR